MFTNRESYNDRVTSRPINGSRVTCRTQCLCRACTRQTRRGMSLMIVMVTISTSLVLTYSFLRTQTIALQINRNGLRRDVALQAAQTGAAVALERIQAADWTGVAGQLTRDVSVDVEGTASYIVNFRQRESLNDGPDDSALSLVIHSTGIWQSATNPNETVKRHVEIVAELNPRVPGRTIRSGDSAAAMDLAANPGSYDRTQDYALFASEDTSLVLDPADRIDGKLWVRERIKIYEDPHWTTAVRREMLQSIGSQFVTDGVSAHPHPFGSSGVPAGESLITFTRTPSSSLQRDLSDLNVSWQQASGTMSLPTIDYNKWRTYRLYDGGFEYKASPLNWRLHGTTLAPSPDNPLGIFFREGSLELGDHVTVRGTLVATGTITVKGHFIRLAGFNWRGEGGEPVIANDPAWPRLPSLVAHNVEIARNSQTTIDGAVVVDDRLRGAGGNFQYESAPEVDFTITATARPPVRSNNRSAC